MSKRAEALAARVKQGAEGLAAYADGLTDEQWSVVVRPDGRKVGVIVHHVASVYPLEVHLASEMAAGKPIEGVTWDVVAEMNAKHSTDFAATGKKETIELLLKNGNAAAELVRAFTDEQLDNAVLVSLYGNPPVTAQFMIEDHAVRHSWHHLAKIKGAVQRASI